MSQNPTYNWSEPQRQAQAGLWFILYKAVLNIIKLIWPLVAALLLQKKSRGSDIFEILLIAIPVFLLLRAIIEFYYFRFYIENDELIIKKGFISRRTVAIPLAKIQAVHLEQSLLHQALDITRLIIDTAGSEKAEAKIDAIRVMKAESLKAFLMHEHKEPLPGEESKPTVAEHPFIRLSFSDLLRLGISSNHIQAFFIVLAFVFSAVQNLREAFGDRLVQSVEDSSVEFLLNAIPLVVILVLFVSVVTSMIRVILMYFDFQLTESVQGYKLKTGLINTRQYLVRFSKIQFISWEANWLRRKLNLFHLEFHQVAGEKVNHKQKAKVPITQPVFLERLLLHYHPEIRSTAHSVHHIHKVYPFRRMLFLGILPVGFILLMLSIFIWKYWFLLLIFVLPYVYINSWFFRKNFRLYVSPDALQVTSGIWGRQNRVLKWYKIQQVILTQSIYQRQHQLASVELVTAGGNIEIPYVSLQLANTIRNYALFEIERSTRAWL